MTIKDIAKAANVSAATVSRIINHKDGNISQDTRERVLRVIEENGYVPYAKIRDRILSQSRSLGLMIPTFNSAFYVRFASEIQQLARENGYCLVLALSSGNGDADMAALDNFSRSQVDGVAVFSASDQELAALKDMHEHGAAVMVLEHFARPGNLAQLYRDSRQIAEECTRLLQASNCAHIGLILRSDCTEQLRQVIYDGYCAALSGAFRDIRQDFIVLNDGGFLDNFRIMCDGGLDGIVCQDADIAHAVYAAAARDGLRIPEDISVVSMEDAPDAANRMPSLTCASTDVAQMAQMVFACLLSQINHTPMPFSSQRLECPVILRDSVRSRKNPKPQILVAGYINTDILLRAPELSRVGKTQVAAHIADYVGGKGANQAYGLGKMGGNVYLMGLLGSDRRGRLAYENLVQAGVKMDAVSFLPELPTGSAYISLYPDGKNSVLIDPGANAAMDPAYIRRHETLLESTQLCLAQTDIPMESVEELWRLCRKYDVPMILNSSYGVRLPEYILDGLCILIMKDEERVKLYPQMFTQEACAKYLLSAGVKNVIFTSGVSSCFYAGQDGSRSYPSYDYPSVDQTGTSDVFTACLVALLTDGVPLPEAIGSAAWAAAYGTTKLGVQRGFPDRDLLEDVRVNHLQLHYPEK